MSARFAMAIDTRLCVGCSACVIACKNENRVPEGAFRDWVVSETRGRFPKLALTNESRRCNHCENAPCVANCPTGASFHAPDGTVQVDRDRCTGCKACIAACPYGARYVHPEGFVDKCTFCYHMGPQTACSNACPTGAIAFGDPSDLSGIVARRIRRADARVLLPEEGTSPQVWYLG